MAKKITVGIDIGTYQVKVVVAEEDKLSETGLPRVIGSGLVESKGLRHGYIINYDDVAKSLKKALAQAEKTSGIRIRQSYLAVGGIGLSSIVSHGQIAISKADSEITQLDINNAIDNAREILPKNFIQNKQILHTIPIAFKIDNKLVFGQPLGMHGDKLEVKVMFVACTEHHIQDIVQAVEECGVNVTNIIASPLAGSLVATNKTQRIAGCVLANIGSETVSVIIFENNVPISLEVFPIGGTDITNDIALGLKIPLEEAECIKLKQSTGDYAYPRKKLEEIVFARLSDIFELIEAHLKKNGRSGLLPAGIILTGGTSGIATIEEMAKASLKLPSSIASLNLETSQIKNGIVKDSSWLVAYGLCLFGLSSANDLPFFGIKEPKTNNPFEKLFTLFKKILP
ncbi:MAG: cell division protein FtsA [Minisyncoccia bacterium]